jgi:hypothetical protein
MVEAALNGLTPADLHAMIRVAGAVADGKSLRLPVEIQVRSLAVTVRCLHALLKLCADGDAAALAAVRAIVALDEEG